ncbi:MAG: hypothetical protein GXO81_05115 [Chlorobi bacterium]|nr:hypothetical protein [Chlorobiota bacterium]
MLRLLAQLAEVQKAYEEAIARADRNFNREVFDAARTGYNQALSVKPGEAYPAEMVARIDSIEDARARLLAEQQASEAARLKALEERRNKAYNESIAMADAYFSNKEYNAASNEYKSALDVKPGEAYPQQRIAEIKGILDQLAEVQKAYDAAIARADRNFNREVFDAARAGYNQALSVKPGEAYPAEMVARIDSIEDARARLLAEQQASKAARLKALEERRNKAYNEAIAMADAHFSDKEYYVASDEYKSALKVKPGETYPQQRIAEIKSILARQAEAQKAYEEAIARADKAFSRNAYPEAQKGYNDALVIKPSEEYPKSQLLKINRLIDETARKQELERSYLTAIAQADSLYNNKQFELSITSYEQALSLKPNEKYPKAQIEAARANILELAKLLERQKARDQAYQNAITQADREFNARNFTQAESGYNNALTIKPGEDYPKKQLVKIAEARRQAILEQYNKIIAEADTDFKNKQYQDARKKYSNALIIIPKDVYAVSRIAEIDNIIESMAAAERERKRIQQDYMLAISQADEAFDLGQYTKANNFYTLALTLKPSEAYPAERIEEIKQILERQKTDEKYRNTLIAAYSLYQMKNYTDSRKEYVKALAIKPNEVYPKSQISKIDKILLEQERVRLIAQQQATQSIAKQQEEVPVAQVETISRKQYVNSEMQQAYDEYIKSADMAFDMKEYNVARFYYREALGIIPDEPHPTGRLREIKKIIDGRMFDRLEREYQQWIDKADEALIGGELAIARAYYNRALGVKTQEQYPRDRLDEIASRLQQQRGQQNLKEYQDLISIADKTLTERNYTVARFYYMKASHLRPSESYPKEQIKKIGRALGH